MRVTDKKQFYDLYYKGALGNTIQQWEHEQFVQLCNNGGCPVPGIGVRCYIKDNPWMRYELTPKGAIEYVTDICRKHGVRPDQFQYSELAPDHRITLQGEVMRSERFVDAKLCTEFSDNPKENRMRVSMERAVHMSGIQPWLLMREKMDGPSWNCLQELFDLYPDSIIEFACYGIPVGVLGWNTIIWEVRNY